MACHFPLLAARLYQAVVHDLVVVNRVIKATQAASGLPLLFQPMSTPHRLVLFTNAYIVTVTSATAGTGYTLFFAGDVPSRGSLAAGSPLVILAWGSRKQLRVTHSTFGAETYALLDGIRAAVEVSCVPAHLTNGVDMALCFIDAVTDFLSLLNTMSTTGLVKPTEFNAGMAALREM